MMCYFPFLGLLKLPCYNDGELAEYEVDNPPPTRFERWALCFEWLDFGFALAFGNVKEVGHGHRD